MTRSRLQKLTIEELVDRFVEIGSKQDQALLYDDLTRFNRLFQEMKHVVSELKSRPGDGRHALLGLYAHPNLQVRLKAAVNSVALAPDEARRTLQEISDTHEHPQAGDAGMTLWTLDEGIFKPT